jgi:hypothetical protein
MPWWIWAEASLMPVQVIAFIVFMRLMRRLDRKRGI